MTSFQRQSARQAISNFFDQPDVDEIEEALFKMCKRLDKKYTDGLAALYGKYAFEKIGELSIAPDRKVEILNEINEKILDWNSVAYEKFRLYEEKERSEHVTGAKVSKGEFTCHNPQCLSQECYYFQVQTRSADEGATTYVICIKCGHRYHFN
jgi:DNA-directed RNA polymerase subunit M/transcription elongation factor TFIIS